MPLHQRREGVLAILSNTFQKPLDKLGIGEPAENSQRVERPELAKSMAGWSPGHEDDSRFDSTA